MTTLAEFTISASRLLDPAGKPVAPLPAFAKDIAELVSLYRSMVLTRAFDAKAIALQRTGRLGTYASSLGQEAVGVGVAAAMRPEDVLLPSFREHGAQLRRGVSLKELFLYWGGDERGNDFAVPREDFPNSVPVGSHAPHAVGVALAFRLRGEKRVAVCVFGDGATSKGDVAEALNMAGVWKLPVVFVVCNNGWAISMPVARQTKAQTLAQKAIAAGIPGEQVDGNDVIAVRWAVENSLARARAGEGAALIEAVTYRLSDHTTADDASRYRDDAEVSRHWPLEPVLRLRRYLTDQRAWGKEQEEQLLHECNQAVEQAAAAYLETPPQSPDTMFKWTYAQLPADLAEQAEAANGLVSGEAMTELTLVQAVNLALRRAMVDDSQVIVLGEDVAIDGGVFRATDGLYQLYGGNRVLDTPLAEGAIAGVSVGLAAQGFRPVAEIQFTGFAYTCIDQLLNHAARLRARTRGRITCPMVLRSPAGGGIHAVEHHSESPEAMFAHIPGLKVVIPSSPARAYGLMLAAIRDPDPVVFLEPTRLYRSAREDVADDGAELPLERCTVLRPGRDVVLVSWGAMLKESLEAAEQLSQENIEAEVIDVATLKPLDTATILESVKRTGRLVVIHEAPVTCGFGAEIAARVAARALTSLLAPIERVAGYDTAMPYPRTESFYMPSVDRIVAAVRRTMAYS